MCLNAERTGGLYGAKRREGHPCDANCYGSTSLDSVKPHPEHLYSRSFAPTSPNTGWGFVETISKVRLLHFGQSSPVAEVRAWSFSFNSAFSETKVAIFILASANSRLRSATRFLNSASSIFLPISRNREARVIAVDTDEIKSDTALSVYQCKVITANYTNGFVYPAFA